MDKYIGKRLDGRYEINEMIGIGGMSVVYKAYDTIDDRKVAIKILKEEFLDNQDFIRRFKNESKAIAVLSHPNIVKVFDVSFGDVIQYIVMEYIEGITLKDYINQQKKVSWKDTVHFATQILMALEHAHTKGIIHRDIKPQNIMLLSDGQIKVTDFGIARFSRSETHTVTNKAIGSVHYISPEQARGDLTDEKADIYSVGVMMYEMLTGKLPFDADSAVSVAIMQMQNDPDPLRKIDLEIPEGLEEITLKAMQKEPLNRYSSSQDMLNAIEQFKENPSIKFEYKYLSDGSPTKYMKAINNVRKDDYGDDYIANEKVDINKDKNAGGKIDPKHLKMVLGVGIGVVLIAIMVAVYALTNSFKSVSKDVDLPNLIGLKFEDVKGKYKFNWETESVYDSSKPEGVIVDQDPKPGSKKVKETATINLKINTSGSNVIVPTIKGLDLEAAKSKLKKANLQFEVLEVNDDDTQVGIVKASDPTEGTKVKANSTVKIYLSKGPVAKKVKVPNVFDKSLTDATNALVGAGLKVSSNLKKDESEKAENTVLSTDPLPGIEVSEGTEIVLTVSTGKPKEKTKSIDVDLPSVNKTLQMEIYIDGALNKTISVNPSYNNKYSFDVTGTSGIKKVNIELNGRLYRAYEINFDNNSVNKTNYPFQDTSSSAST